MTEEQPMPAAAIDCHAHVFHRGLPLAEPRRYTPAYDAPLSAYLGELDANGMSHGVLVQPSFLGTDNSYLVESLQAAKGRLRGIAVVAPDIAPDALDALDEAGVAGIRLNLVGQALPAFEAAPWPGFLAEIARRGWHVEVQRRAGDLKRVLPALIASGAPIVVDHFGLPDPALGIEDPGFTHLLSLGGSADVHVKISAPYRSGAKGEAIARAAYPLLRDAFGAGRVLWGSDWPHTQFEAEQSYTRNRAFLDRLVPDEGERRRILAENPLSLYRFG